MGLLRLAVVQQAQKACTSEKAWKELAGDLARHVSWKEKFRPNRVPAKWVRNIKKR